jgi:hypothetical protein
MFQTKASDWLLSGHNHPMAGRDRSSVDYGGWLVTGYPPLLTHAYSRET